MVMPIGHIWPQALMIAQPMFEAGGGPHEAPERYEQERCCWNEGEENAQNAGCHKNPGEAEVDNLSHRGLPVMILLAFVLQLFCNHSLTQIRNLSGLI